MTAEGRTLFLMASQRLKAQPKAGGSQEPAPGLTAAGREAHRITPGQGDGLHPCAPDPPADPDPPASLGPETRVPRLDV